MAEEKARSAPKAKAKAKPKAKAKAKAKPKPKPKPKAKAKAKAKGKVKAKPKTKKRVNNGATKKTSPEWEAAKAEQHRLKRLAILRAAAQSLSEKGYHGTSLTDVARRLNMTNGALYYYFKSKEELAFECLLATHAQTQACLAKAEEIGQDGRDKVETFVREVIVAMEENPTWIHPGEAFFLKSEHRRTAREASSENQAYLARLIQEGVKDKSIGLCEPRATALLIMGSLVFLHNWIPTGGYTPEKLSEMASGFISKSLAPIFPRK